MRKGWWQHVLAAGISLAPGSWNAGVLSPHHPIPNSTPPPPTTTHLGPGLLGLLARKC